MPENTPSISTMRRAFKKKGYVIKKSRWRAESVDNHGGFMVIDPWRNAIVDGERFNIFESDLPRVLKRLPSLGALQAGSHRRGDGPLISGT